MTIWQEARGESYSGKVGVGEVIRNRVKLAWQGQNTVAGVVLYPLQFSCWNNYSPSREAAGQLDDTDPIVAECIKAWAESETSNLTNGATHYFNPKIVHPAWANALGATVQVPIGNHIFVKGVAS